MDNLTRMFPSISNTTRLPPTIEAQAVKNRGLQREVDKLKAEIALMGGKTASRAALKAAIVELND